MSSETPPVTVEPIQRPRTLAPILTLLLLAPILSELLSGATRLSAILFLVPSTGVWGCAALLIREMVRRRHGAWTSILLLGIALAIAEECIVQQTSLAPLITVDPAHVYSRALGVNWEYFLWALGFESVWAVVAPIALTELLLPQVRGLPWLRRRGILIATVILLLSCAIAWYTWTQVFVPQAFPSSVYHVPWHTTLLSLLAIAALVVISLQLKPRHSPSAHVPSPWLAGVLAFVLALPWYLQIVVAFGGLPHLPPAAALASGCGLAIVACLTIGRWIRSLHWQSGHTLAVLIGLVLATVVGGSYVLYVARATLLDRCAQIAFGVVALALLGRRALRPHAQPA